MKKTAIKTGILLIILFGLIIFSCKKDEKVPALTTSAVINILGTSATAGGTITNEGTATVLSRGVCWSTGTTPTIADNKTLDGAGAGSFTSSITGLNGATVYYVRAYATNSVGTGYGMAMSFTSLGQAPTPTNSAATNVTTTSATINGSVNPNYLSTVITFEYGTTTSYGSTATATQSPATGNTVTNVSADITGLSAGTVYHLRVKAVNSLGTTYSSDVTFTTLGQVPTVTTLAATNISTTNASVNGTVNANYLSSVVTYDYGTTTGYGSTVTATQSPVTGNSNTSVSANITGLTLGTTYHFRAKAVNSLGTSYGSDLTFATTTSSTTITDVDGNIYNIITIGSQVWMKENLKTTKYSDGTAISLVNTNATWSALTNTSKAYCWYNDNPANKDTYGALYTWGAAMNGAVSSIANPSNVQGACPTGWHLPSDDEWTQMYNYLIANGYNYDGTTTENKIAKSLGSTSGWQSTSATGSAGSTDYPSKRNSSGFTALPGGQRYNGGTFDLVGIFGFWWSSTEYDSTQAWYRYLYYSDTGAGRIYINEIKKGGYSVRCVKN